MKHNRKKLLLLSLCMMVAGGILTGLGLFFGGYPGVTLSGEGLYSPYRENQKTPYLLKKTKLEHCSNIEFVIDSYANIQILSSRDSDFYLEYKLDGCYPEPTYEVKDHTLHFSQKESRRGQTYFFNLSLPAPSKESTPYVTLYVPEEQKIKNLHLFSSMGNISLSDLNVEQAELTSEYGNVNLQTLQAKQFSLHIESGNLEAESLTADQLLLSCDYGNATLHHFQGKNADLSLESGNLHLDAKELEQLTCTNTYGNTIIRLPEDLASYTIDAHTDYGQIHLPEQTSQGRLTSSDMEETYQLEGSSGKKLSIHAEDGNITLSQEFKSNTP